MFCLKFDRTKDPSLWLLLRDSKPEQLPQDGSPASGVHRLSPGLALLQGLSSLAREGAGTDEQQHQGVDQGDQEPAASR